MTINRIVVCEVHDDSAWLLRVACIHVPKLPKLCRKILHTDSLKQATVAHQKAARFCHVPAVAVVVAAAEAAARDGPTCFASERPLFGHERQIIEMPDVHEQSHSADLQQMPPIPKSVAK